MNRTRYRLDADDLAEAGDAFLAKIEYADATREAFVARHNGEAYLASPFRMEAVRFPGIVPAGWVRSEHMLGFAEPDVSTDLGRKILTEMRALPPRPMPTELSEKIGFHPVLKASPAGQAVFVGVERIGREVYVSVPTFDAEDVAKNPALAWEPVPGMGKVPEQEYRQERQRALDRRAARLAL